MTFYLKDLVEAVLEQYLGSVCTICKTTFGSPAEFYTNDPYVIGWGDDGKIVLACARHKESPR